MAGPLVQVESLIKRSARLTVIHLALVYKRFRQIRGGSSRKLDKRNILTCFSIQETVSIDDAKRVQAFLVALSCSPIKPHFRYLDILSNPFTSQVHTAKIESGMHREEHVRIIDTLLAVLLILGRIIASPDFSGNFEEVRPGCVEVFGQSGRSFCACAYSSGRSVDTTMVVDLAQAVARFDVPSICMEL